MKTAIEICERVKAEKLARENSLFHYLLQVVDEHDGTFTVSNYGFENGGKKVYDPLNSIFLETERRKSQLEELGFSVTYKMYKEMTYVSKYIPGGFFTKSKWISVEAGEKDLIEITISACCGEE